MSKRGFGEKIKLSSYDDMFGTEDMAGAQVAAATVSDGQIVELPLKLQKELDLKRWKLKS